MNVLKKTLIHAGKVFLYSGVSAGLVAVGSWATGRLEDVGLLFLVPIVNSVVAGTRRYVIERQKELSSGE